MQTLTYKGRVAGSASDDISIIAAISGGFTSATATISVSNYASGAPSPQFEWDTSLASGTFSDFASWTVSGPSPVDTAPGGTNVALFRAGSVGAYTVSGDGAVDQVKVTATTTLTGQVIAQGSSGIALVVNDAGALMLAGGAEFSAQAEAIVGVTGEGLLTLMGGALALTGLSTDDALVIGGAAGSNGTVVNLEQITANGTVVVGQSGTGTLALLGVASSMTAGAATIGRSAGAHGAALVNGGFWAIGQSTPQVTSSGELIVGDAGSGTLLIDGAANGIAGQVTAFDATIGKQAGSEGSVVLDGGLLLVANTNATGSNTLAVGNSGTGSLVIENFSEVAVGAASAAGADNNGLLIVGRAADGRGRIRIGDYSALLVYGDAHVGEAGVGTVTVGTGADHDALFALNGTLTLGAAGQVMLGGLDATVRAEAIHVAAGGVVSGSGTLSGVAGGNKTVTFADIHNDGSIVANGGDLLLYGGVTGTGELSMARRVVTHAADGRRHGPDSGLRRQRTCPAQRSARLRGHHHGLQRRRRAGAGEHAGEQRHLGRWRAGARHRPRSPSTEVRRQLCAGRFHGRAGRPRRHQCGGWTRRRSHDDLRRPALRFPGRRRVRGRQIGPIPARRWQIQIETAGIHGVASITTELAAAFGNNMVTFAIGRPISLHVDGAPDTALHVSGTQAVPGGTLAQLSVQYLLADLGHRPGRHRQLPRRLAGLGREAGPPGRTGIGAGSARQPQRPGNGIPTTRWDCPDAPAQQRGDRRPLRRCLAKWTLATCTHPPPTIRITTRSCDHYASYFFRLMFQNAVAGAIITPSMSARSAIGWYHSPRWTWVGWSTQYFCSSTAICFCLAGSDSLEN